MAYPCTDDPSEILEAIERIVAKQRALEVELDKLDKFVNGTALEEVQLGEGPMTPTLRNLSHLVKSAAATLDGSDVSGKLSDAANGGTTPRTLADRFGSDPDPLDFGAAGDGETDDSAAFDVLEENAEGRVVDLHGYPYAVEADADGLPPHGNQYVNGSFAVNTSGGTYTVSMDDEVSSRHDGGTSSGIGSWPNWFLAFYGADAVARASLFYDADENRLASRINDVTAIGHNALAGALRNTARRCSSNIAIGAGVMSEGTYVGPHNIGIGIWALHDLQSTKENDANLGGFDADRNVAIGTLCYPHLTQGRANVGLGRDIGQSLTTGSYNSCIGYGSMGGYAPVGLDGTIVNTALLTGSFNTAVGAYALHSIVGSSSGNVAVGAQCAESMKAGTGNIFVGRWAGRYIDYYTSTNGKKLKYIAENNTVSYVQNGTSLRISLASSGAVVGGYVVLAFKSGAIYDGLGVKDDRQTMYVTAIDDNGFTVESPVEYAGASGAVAVEQVELADEQAPVGANGTTVIGYAAGQYALSLDGSNVIGAWALLGTASDDIANSDRLASAQSSNILGSLSCTRSAVSNSNVIGYRAAGYQSTNTADNANGLIGYSEVIGMLAVKQAKNVSRSIVAGYSAADACQNSIGDSVVIGANACGNTTETINASVVIGYDAGHSAKTNTDVFIGRLAANAYSNDSNSIGTTTNCIGIGHGSFYINTDLSGGVSNSIAIGYHAAVTGSNQFQLGDANVTTYAYGSVQNRSDARDKADIRDTELGLDFLKALRPVDFKWDYRDAYVDSVEHEVETVDEDGNVSMRTEVETVRREKDGSRKRNRFHHGLIAQEVKTVLDEKGIDFGGYQDHKVNGGADVLTLGYEEFIAPIIKAIQQIDARLSALEA